MRVVMNGRFLAQPVTGVQRYARELSVALDDAIPHHPDIALTLLTPPLTAPPPAFKNIEIVQTGKFGGHAWEQFELPRHLKRDDVLFCPANTAPAYSLISGQPTVVTVHDLSYKYFPSAYSTSFRLVYNSLMPLIMRRAKQVITVSEAERAQILTVYPSAASRLIVVPNGGLSDQPIETAARLEAMQPYILYVGSFTKRKNFPALMAVANRLLKERQNLRFVFVGGSPKIFTGIDVDPALMHERMVFEGQVNDQTDLMAYYASAEAFVFPSLYESSGLPPTEAMACGCPAVVSRIPALAERCGDAALYCDPNNRESILEALRTVLDDRAARNSLVAKGYARSRLFSWKDCATQSLTALRSAAQH